MPGFFRRVLVPLDTGPTTQQALPHLSHLLSGACDEAVLTAVADDPFLADASRMYVEGIANRLHHLGLAVRTRVEVGAAAEKILEAAQAEAAEAILLSAPFRPGLGRVVFEDPAEGVVRQSPVPVLVLRPGVAGPGRDQDLKTVLVPLDGRPASRLVLPLAEGLARSEGGSLVLLHVLANDAGEETAAGVERELAELVRGAASRSVQARVQMERGEAVETILATADRLRADLIVLRTHGRGGPSKLPLGGVTERVMRSATVAVLAVSGAVRDPATRAVPAA